MNDISIIVTIIAALTVGFMLGRGSKADSRGGLAEELAQSKRNAVSRILPVDSTQLWVHSHCMAIRLVPTT
jgi:hypothetical protein